MLRRIVHSLIARSERELRVNFDYLRDLYRISPRAFWKFARARPFGTHRERAPTSAVFAAHLASARHDDCGSCVQIVVNMGLKEGIKPVWIQTLLRGETDGLPPALALGFRFGHAIVTNSPALESIRHEVITAWGEKGMVDLACAVSFARVYPTMKRAMGHAVSCELVRVGVEPPQAKAA